jgi:hypothetical protein
VNQCGIIGRPLRVGALPTRCELLEECLLTMQRIKQNAHKYLSDGEKGEEQSRSHTMFLLLLGMNF